MKSPTGIRFSDDEYKKIALFASENNMKFSDVVRQAVHEYIDPDYGKGYLTLRELSKIDGDSDIELLFSQFLDDFAHAKDKFSLIADEPTWNKKNAGRWFYSFAAAAHKLADDNMLPVPQWCLKNKYFPKKEYFAFNAKDKKIKDYLKKNTPKEYCWRNLFLGPNILERA